MIVFVDTAAWIALHDKTDDLHDAAIRARSDLYHRKTRFVTSEFVLLEFADALRYPRTRGDTYGVITKLKADSTIVIESASSTLFDEALDLYNDRPDKEWSLTECSSFVIMKNREIETAFTSDHHFEPAGFTRLL